MAYSEKTSAATIPVTNCNDDGEGSLRNAIAASLSDDTIDLRSLRCRRIVLTSGALHITQTSLTLHGPGLSKLAISGNDRFQVINHTTEYGELRLIGLSFEHGRVQQPLANGGCIASAGNLRAYDIEVRQCTAYGVSPDPLAYTEASGGGISAGDIFISYSGILQNQVRGSRSNGGGISAGRTLTMTHVVVRGNHARRGAGVATGGSVHLDRVIIANNRGDQEGGGLYLFVGGLFMIDSAMYGNRTNGTGGAFYLDRATNNTIVNSTISGNRARTNPAGFVGAGDVRIFNNTIAFNAADHCDAAFHGTHLLVQSTIAANNTCEGNAVDRDLYGDPTLLHAIRGSDNLIQSANVPLPPDTIGADPMLAPLADNGGRTMTNALMPGSPAIDRGNNASFFLGYDQRGVGFPRVNGTRADIGAFER